MTPDEASQGAFSADVAGWHAPPARGLLEHARGVVRFLILVVLALRVIWRLRDDETARSVRAVEVQEGCAAGLRALGMQVRVRGRTPSGPAVVVSNHRSYLDIPVLAGLFPTVFLARAQIAEWPLLGRMAQVAGSEFVDRGRRGSGAAAVRRLSAVLEEGLPVVFFAEGTTKSAPGLLPFQIGAFRLARAVGAPVVPVAIEYSVADAGWDASMPDDSLFPHFVSVLGRRRIGVTVTFGEPQAVGDSGAVRDSVFRFVSEHVVMDAASPPG